MVAGAAQLNSRQHAEAWIAAYVEAWRTPGVDLLADLFTEDATYSMAPYEPTTHGLDAIGELWERERQGPDERFTITSEVVAAEGETAVARVEVHYDREPPEDFRDLWVMQFAADGRCQAFEEWPFAPR